MLIYSLASTSDLETASSRKFSTDFDWALKVFIQLADRYFDRSIIKLIERLGKQVVDTTVCREWCQTIYEIRDFCNGTEPVPNSSFTSHLEIDRGDTSRIAELLFWQLYGALATPGACIKSPEFQLPANIVLSGLGALEIKHLGSDVKCTQLDWRGDVPILMSGKNVLQTKWKPHIKLTGTGLNCVIPLENPALTSARLQDFPIVGAKVYSEKWGFAVLEVAYEIKRYSADASNIVERFVSNVLALICGDHVIGSASRQEAFGLIFLPAILDRRDQLLECLLHEAMHQYLFRIEACARLFELTSPSDEVFYSPWRQDKRSLRMTLHGSFVFAAVADLYLWVANNPICGIEREQAQQCSYQRYRESSIALGVVRKYGVMTKIGVKVIDALCADLGDIGSRIELDTDKMAQVDRNINDHLNLYDEYLH
jgi:hypothetical protein